MSFMCPESLRTIFRNLAPRVREHEPLATHTTVRIGGPAHLMVFPANETELAEALTVLTDSAQKVEWTVLGGGANVLADSRGFDGVVLNLSRWVWDLSLENGVLTVGGGMSMRDVVLETTRQGWCGVDYMAVVPGTIGGAVCINAGTHSEGGFIADRFLWAETLSPDGAKHRYSAEEMGFGYRTSRLQGKHEIVTRAAFQLVRCEEAGKTPKGLMETFDGWVAARKRKFPMEFPNFGSTFRSPGAPLPPAGKLIDELGMKGLRIGNAGISERHGNFIVNLGNATSDDVLALMRRMRDAVRERYGVTLRPEVCYLANREARQQAEDLFPQ
jgi:UDP-N-acetylmuramate dehydrogenase